MWLLSFRRETFRPTFQKKRKTKCKLTFLFLSFINLTVGTNALDNSKISGSQKKWTPSSLHAARGTVRQSRRPTRPQPRRPTSPQPRLALPTAWLAARSERSDAPCARPGIAQKDANKTTGSTIAINALLRREYFSQLRWNVLIKLTSIYEWWVFWMLHDANNAELINPLLGWTEQKVRSGQVMSTLFCVTGR